MMAVVSVEDDTQGSVGKLLMPTTVRFVSCGGRTCFRWITKTDVFMCSTRQQWGPGATTDEKKEQKERTS